MFNRVIINSKPLCVVFWTMCILSLAINNLSAADDGSPASPLWSKPISSDQGPPGYQSGPVLIDILRSSKEPTIFLATDARRPSLIVDSGRSGLGRIIPLPLTGDPLRIVEGADETLWVGGVKGSRIGIASGRISEAYLARLRGRQGEVIWEKAFGENAEKSVEDLASLPSRDVVVVGKHNDKSWLARVSSTGEIVWEQYFGLGKGSSVKVVNNKVIVAGFDAGFRGDGRYEENVVLWIYDDSGQLLEQRILREGINTQRADYLGKIWMDRFGDGVYIYSGWVDALSPKPFEIAKLNAEGQLIWHEILPDLIVRNPGRETFAYCSIATVVLANGDPLVACAWLKSGTLIRVNSATGHLSQKPLAIADCDQASRASLFIRQQDLNSAFIFGSRRRGDWDASCTWLTETEMPLE